MASIVVLDVQAMTSAELAATVHPYLTMVVGLRLAAQTFDRDVATVVLHGLMGTDGSPGPTSTRTADDATDL